MRTIQPQLAHRELVRQHNTLRWTSDNGVVSVRKTAGRYVVRLDDHFYGKTVKSDYATLAGALVAAESLREWYL